MCKYRVEYSGRKTILGCEEPLQMQMWSQKNSGLTKKQVKMILINLDIVRMSGYLYAHAEVYCDDGITLIISADYGAYRFYRLSSMGGSYIRRVSTDPIDLGA